MKTLLVSMMVLAAAHNLLATPIIGNNSSWGGNALSEVSPFGDGSYTTINSLTGGGGGATISFTGDGFFPAVRVTDQGANFSGNFISPDPNNPSSLFVTFTFVAQTVTPYSLNLYFKSTNLNEWRSSTTLSLAGLAVGTPTVFTMNITENQWIPYGGGDIATDYANVKEFGFELFGGNYPNQPQSYQFYDVYFSVPEPETVWMILVVLASLGMTFRVRLGELVGQVKARIKA